jgi:predicted N-acetyltransferase YhbS
LPLQKIDFNSVEYEYHKVADGEMLDDDFKSEEQEFTDYYHVDSLQDVRERLVRLYLLKIDGKIMGYVTLAMAHIRNDATPEIESKQINGTIPALLISHLAVRAGNHRRGIGEELLRMVLGKLVPSLHTRAGCRYVMLNPRDDQGVRDFYTAFGFDYIDKFKSDGNSDKESDACLYDLLKKS